MTRSMLNRRLRIATLVLIALIVVAFVAKLGDANSTLAKLYDFIKDTSLLVATLAVAYLANLYQRREQFLLSLREQWRDLVQAKAALVTYCRSGSDIREYAAALRSISECIDNMRIVYLNVGETDELIGLYPYGPMHHMRVVFEKLDPRQDAPTQVDREAALQEIMEAFNAIREHFLDEFDLVEPAKPILIYKMRRSKRSGATAKALALHDRQADLLKRLQQNG